MKKRKLQVFYHEKGPVYVVESLVKSVMKMATEGEFTELKTTVLPIGTDGQKLGMVVFDYKTNLGRGTIILEGQKQ